jgi:dienelactone hydrolase
MSTDEVGLLGPVFARHGYVLLLLFRQGIGLSRGQGTADGDLMDRALTAEGMRGRNRVQLELLDGEELNEVSAGLAFLKTLPGVDPHRVAVAGHSFGGSLTLALVGRNATIRAAVVFGPAAASWGRSPELRTRLRTAVGHATAPVFFIHAANDYSVAPAEELAAEMRRLGKPEVVKIYPAVGRSAREGHSLVYLSVPTWERDVFRFLDEHVGR